MIIKNKITVVFILTVLLLSFISGALAEPFNPAGEGENLILNGGFEDGYTGWSCSGKWGEYASISEEQVYNDSKALKLSTNIGNSPWVSKGITNFYPGTEYEVSAWVNTGTLSGTRALFKIETYRTETITSNSSLGSYNGGFYNGTDGGWQRVTFSFIPEKECRLVIILVRLYAIGTIYVDDVALKQSGSVKTFFLETDNFFYYSDWDNGFAAVELSRLFTELESGSASFWLYDGEEVLDHKPGVPFTGTRAEYIFDVGLIPRTGEEFILKATVYDSGGNPAGTETMPVFRYNRPACLDKDGNYIVDKKIFNPVFSYHHPEKDFDAAVEAGINLVQAYKPTAGYDKMFEHANDLGIKIMFPLYPGMKPAGSEQNIANTTYYINKYKGHPALFGWIIMDEPFWNDCTEEDLIESYKLVKSLDSSHPIIITEPVSGNFRKTAKFTDILIIDPYPGNTGKQLTSVADLTYATREAVNEKKPVYTLLQTFDYQGYMPTATETKQMIYQALMAGAKGVGYYCFEAAAGGVDLNMTGIWGALTSLDYSQWFGLLQSEEYREIKSHTENYFYAEYRHENYSTHLLLNKTKTVQSIEIKLVGGQIEVTEGNPENVSLNARRMFIEIPPSSLVMVKEDTSEANYIFNGGFEEGALDWTSMWYGEVTGETAHSGNACLKLGGIEGKGGSRGNASQKAVLPEGTYKLSFYYKNMLNGYNSLAIPIVTINGLEVWRPASSPGDWASHEIYFTAKENEEIFISLGSARADGFGIYYDDVSITAYRPLVSFMDDDFQKIAAISRVKGADLNALIIPGGNINKCTAVLALYEIKGDGKQLKEVKMQNAPFSTPVDYGEGTYIPAFTLTVGIPDDGEVYVAEALLWDSLDMITPQGKKSVLA